MAPLSNKGEQTPVGIWNLVSLESGSGNGRAFPFGRRPSGLLIMTPEGYWSVVINSGGRKKFRSNLLFEGSTEEKAAAASTCLAYAGPYQIRGNKIIVRPKASLFPNFVGSRQIRAFELKRDTLVLRPSNADEANSSAKITWRRIR